jgi:hypothetical protein
MLVNLVEITMVMWHATIGHICGAIENLLPILKQAATITAIGQDQMIPCPWGQVGPVA